MDWREGLNRGKDLLEEKEKVEGQPGSVVSAREGRSQGRAESRAVGSSKKLSQKLP